MLHQFALVPSYHILSYFHVSPKSTSYTHSRNFQLLIQVVSPTFCIDRQEDVSWARAFEPIGHAIGTGMASMGKNGLKR